MNGDQTSITKMACAFYEFFDTPAWARLITAVSYPFIEGKL